MNAATIARLENAERIGPAPVEVKVSASPYVWRDPTKIPRLPWVYGRWLLRDTVTAVVAPGGVGKTTLLAGMALAMATGRSLLDKATWEGPKRVWIWNLEDDMDQLSRAIQSAALRYGISEQDIAGHLFVDSAMEGSELCTAVEVDGQFKLLQPLYDAIVNELTLHGIDVLIVDPFVSSHEVEENANSKIDKIVKAWGRVAKAAHCAVVLVHHTSKAGAGEVTVLSARGAKSLTDACRATLVLNRMEVEQADRLGIDHDERRRYFSVQDDKHNRAPAEKADWYRLASVDLGNGAEGRPGDNIGVAEPWCPPDPFDSLTTDHLYRVQLAVAEGSYKAHHSADEWAGYAVADVLGLDVRGKKGDRARVLNLLKTWTDNKAFKVEDRQDKNRQWKKFLAVDKWANEAPATPGKGVAVQGVAVEQQSATLHPAPLRGGGIAAAAGNRDAGVAERPATAAPRVVFPAGNPAFKPILAPGETGNEPIPGWDD